MKALKVNRVIRKIYLLLSLTALIQFNLLAQQALKVGEQAPTFKVKTLDNGSSQILRLSDFKDRWLVIDFWTRACVYCIETFPKFNELAIKLKGKASFLLVGNNSQKYNKGIETLYSKIAQSRKFQMTSAFDSVIFDNYQVSSTPHLVIIDPRGKIKAITYSAEVNDEKLEKLFSGETVDFVTKPGEISEPEPDTIPIKNKILLTIEAENDPIPHQSKISKWRTSDEFNLNLNLDNSSKTGHYKTGVISLKRLYMLAYLGKTDWDSKDSLYQNTWKRPLMVMQDSSLFVENLLHEKGLYNYELKLKYASNKVALMAAIRSDLKKLFGYQASFENEKSVMPYFKLVKLKSGNKMNRSTNLRKVHGDPSGYSFKGITIADLIMFINKYHPRQVVIDYTGIKFPIDLELEADMTALSAINEGLKAKGFELISDYKPFKVLIIKDGGELKNRNLANFEE